MEETDQSMAEELAVLEGKPRAILDTAARLFAQQGYQKTSVDEIARLAGVSTGTVYYYFKSKELLLEAVQLRSVEAWNEATHTAARAAPDSRAARIATALRASAAYAMKDPVMRGLLTQDPRVFLPHNDKLKEAIIASIDVEYSLSLGAQTGELRSDLDVVRTSEAIRIVHDAMIRELFASPEWSRSVDDTARLEAVIDLIIYGILARPEDRQTDRTASDD